jgi:hypothetical protein
MYSSLLFPWSFFAYLVVKPKNRAVDVGKETNQKVLLSRSRQSRRIFRAPVITFSSILALCYTLLRERAGLVWGRQY